MKWKDIHIGHITQAEIQEHVKDREWQELRLSLKRQRLIRRLQLLNEYLRKHSYSRPANVRVTNYINALKRGGMINDDD